MLYCRSNGEEKEDKDSLHNLLLLSEGEEDGEHHKRTIPRTNNLITHFFYVTNPSRNYPHKVRKFTKCHIGKSSESTNAANIVTRWQSHFLLNLQKIVSLGSRLKVNCCTMYIRGVRENNPESVNKTRYKSYRTNFLT